MAFFFDPEMLMNGEFDFDDDFELEVLADPFNLPETPPYAKKPKVPTCTEDGIPIRKIYVANLPPKVTRKELFEFFTQYGVIKNCWLKTSSNGNIKPYAFVTFINPQDAHKALKVPRHKNFLHGKMLRVQPADSWHQPISGPDGNLIWDNRKPAVAEQVQDGTVQKDDQAGSSQQEEGKTEEAALTMLDILNPDCIAHILSYIPIRDLIRSEHVSKRWHAMIYDHYLSFRTFKTSCWESGSLTTAMLRNLLQRVGPTLTSLHIDCYGERLNDRTAHTIGKFCPNLEKLEINDMTTENWNPTLYCCKKLHTISFNSCKMITDLNLASLFNMESSIHTLRLSGLENTAGGFLEHMKVVLHTLDISACPSVNDRYLAAAFPKMTELKSLKLSTVRGFRAIPAMVHLTKLEELQISNFMYEASTDFCQVKEQLAESISKMPELRSLSLNQNMWFSDRLLKTIADTCPKLTKLGLVGAARERTEDQEVTLPASGLAALVSRCRELEYANVSQNARLAACVAALRGAAQLRTLVARGSELLADGDVLECVRCCQHLQSIDLFGCTKISEGLVSAVIIELEKRPRHMTLYLGDTQAEEVEELPKHPLLTIDFSERYASKQFIGFYVDPSDYEDYEDDNDDYDLEGAEFYDVYDDEYVFGRHNGYDIETGEYVDDELIDDLF